MGRACGSYMREDECIQGVDGKTRRKETTREA
jgi:hypothetical protein